MKSRKKPSAAKKIAHRKGPRHLQPPKTDPLHQPLLLWPGARLRHFENRVPAAQSLVSALQNQARPRIFRLPRPLSLPATLPAQQKTEKTATLPRAKSRKQSAGFRTSDHRAQHRRAEKIPFPLRPPPCSRPKTLRPRFGRLRRTLELQHPILTP